MHKYTLSQALGNISDDLLLEATQLPHKRGAGRIVRRLVAVAAVIAILLTALLWPSEEKYITGPGILAVTAYAWDMDTGEIVSEKLEAGVKLDNSRYWSLGVSLYPGLPIFLDVDSKEFSAEKITYDVSVNCGEYVAWREEWIDVPVSTGHKTVGKMFSVQNDAALFWKYTSYEYQPDIFYSEQLDRIYTKVVIRCEDHIIGYAVLQFNRAYGRDVKECYPEKGEYWEGKEDLPVDAYFTNLIASVVFPRVNGEYQNITLEYVESCMAELCTR